MTFMLIIILALLIATLVKKNKLPAARPIAAVLAVAAIVLVVMINLGERTHPARAEELLYQKSVGYMLGKAVAEQHPEGGTFAVFNMPEFSRRPNMHTAKMKGLAEALSSKSYKLVVLDLSALPMPLEQFITRFEGGYEMPEFWDLLNQVPGRSGLISLLGLPPPPPSKLENVPVYAAGQAVADDDEGVADWPGLAAYVQTKPNQVIRNSPPKRGSMEDVFASRYVLITP